MRKALWTALVLVLAFIGLKFGASSYTPWTNEPAQAWQVPSEVHLGTDIRYRHEVSDSLVLVVTVSGGGMRAAAFAYGVLEGLKETQIVWEGQSTDLFSEIDLISGVSGGGILATYATLYGEGTFPAFKEKFLYQDFQTHLVSSIFAPTNLVRLTSPNYGRGHLLIDHLNELFEDKTFADLPLRPRLLLSATDLSRSRGFQFTPEQFSLICSDLASTPLSFAAGASSAVPFLLSPVSLKNYSTTDLCPNTTTIYRNPDAQIDSRISQLYSDKLTYLDATARPYIHLVDGAVSDNLGLRSILDRVSMGDNINALVRDAPPHSIKRMVFVVISAEIVPPEDIDQVNKTPNLMDVIGAMRFSRGLRTSAETLEMLRVSARAWTEQLKSPEMNNQHSIFTKDSELHVIELSLKAISDSKLRDRLLKIATRFYLPQNQVDELIAAGKNSLKTSPEFKKMLQSLTSASTLQH